MKANGWTSTQYRTKLNANCSINKHKVKLVMKDYA